MKTTIYSLLMTWSTLTFLGCGGGASDQPEVVDVTGTVMQGGTPVVGALVEFIPENGRPSQATTNEQGEFTLNYLDGVDGAIAGTHKVRINPNPIDSSAAGGGEEAPAAAPPEPILFNNPDPVEVQPDGENTFTFDIAEWPKQRG
ncbi:transthyretin-like family protein [Thalassoroseus pseudoceratinae]|uniref:carboxypeptidase-like regulatory domain-containing protein n=1 Tax=Thalassoroseus pseudoceratinae TaxID=2713176 RepID=UPI0014247753|nr:carboxypeptidase-like regulatory domain-containing protein [Thalassoroseus pseudoceratinae]